MVRYSRQLAALALLIPLSMISGCGVRESKLAESGATLSGTITHKDTPIEFAMVIVQGPNNVTTQGYVGSDGKYHIQNVPLGEVKIGVNTSAARGDFESKSKQQNAGALDPKASKKISAPTFHDVPAKYNSPDQSGLSTTIQKGENTYDIKCTD